MLFILLIILLIPEIRCQWSSYGDRYIQCYSCTDCPEPFFHPYAHVIITRPDFGYCMKTVLYVSDSRRRLISKGFTRNCVPEWTNDIHIYCCSFNLCNSSNIISISTLFTISLFIIAIYFSIL